MQLFETNTDRYAFGAIVCRQSPWTSMFGAVVFIGIFAGATIWAFQEDSFIWKPFAFGTVLVTKWMAGIVIKAFGAGNWTVAIQPDELWINIRSFHNTKFAPATTLVRLDYDEISTAQMRTNLTTASMGGEGKVRQRMLDLTLSDRVDTQELRQAIVEETRRQTPESNFFGIRSRGRTNHVPVRLTGDWTLRIYWTTSSASLTPRLPRALEELGKYVEVLSAADDTQQTSPEVAATDIDHSVQELVREGRHIEAIKVLRRQQGLSLKEAKAVVDRVDSGAGDHGVDAG